MDGIHRIIRTIITIIYYNISSGKWSNLGQLKEIIPKKFL